MQNIEALLRARLRAKMGEDIEILFAYPTATDHIEFHVHKSGKATCGRISGLELLQNSQLAMLEDLVGARVDKANQEWRIV